MDPHAVSELYQHVITAATILGPLFVAMGTITLLGWRVSWGISRRLSDIDSKLNIMWKAFCKQHKIDPNGGEAMKGGD